MEMMQEGFVMIRIKASTRQFIRRLAKSKGQNMVETLDTIIREAIALLNEDER